MCESLLKEVFLGENNFPGVWSVRRAQDRGTSLPGCVVFLGVGVFCEG